MNWTDCPIAAAWWASDVSVYVAKVLAALVEGRAAAEAAVRRCAVLEASWEAAQAMSSAAFMPELLPDSNTLAHTLLPAGV